MKQANYRLKELRDKLEMSQIDLASKVGVTQAAISAIELGTIKSPTVDLAQRIAQALNSSVEYLFPVENDNAA
jgi:transcriptional regulator with XRE-family HTH domain